MGWCNCGTVFRTTPDALVKSLFVVCCVVSAFCGLNAQVSGWQPSPGHTQAPIWPGVPPDARPASGAEVVTFLLQAENDNVDDVRNSLVYYIALKNAGVPAELHVYAEGGHAFGLRRTARPIAAWPWLVETWLKTIGMISD